MKRRELKNLFNLRKKIDLIDDLLLRYLIIRIDLVKRIFKIKKKYGIPFYSKKREIFIFNRCRILSKKMGISPKIIENIFKEIIRGSL